MDEKIKPVKGPEMSLPEGRTVCTVSAVDTTCYLTVPANTLVQPAIRGHEYMNFPTIAFLLEHAPTGKKVMYDLGCRKDFWNLPAPIANTIDSKVPGIRVDKTVADILIDGGENLEDIKSAIISHHHYDHMGDLTTFPRKMGVIVGPGFKSHFMPGYPTNEDSPTFEDAFEGRNLKELDFSESPVVAGYPAIDHFGDGSLWILNTPGHATGHISALVRTTPNSFIFLGGDICHFGGSYRPTQYMPMPTDLTPEDAGCEARKLPSCVFAAALNCHPAKRNQRVRTYYEPCSREDSWYMDPIAAADSIERLKAVDAHSQVLSLIAHDPSVPMILPLFPDGSLNDWRKQGWKEKLRWRFLNELPLDDQPQQFLVPGLFKGGKLIKPIAWPTAGG